MPIIWAFIWFLFAIRMLSKVIECYGLSIEQIVLRIACYVFGNVEKKDQEKNFRK